MQQMGKEDNSKALCLGREGEKRKEEKKEAEKEMLEHTDLI